MASSLKDSQRAMAVAIWLAVAITVKKSCRDSVHSLDSLASKCVRIAKVCQTLPVPE